MAANTNNISNFTFPVVSKEEHAGKIFKANSKTNFSDLLESTPVITTNSKIEADENIKKTNVIKSYDLSQQLNSSQVSPGRIINRRG